MDQLDAVDRKTSMCLSGCRERGSRKKQRHTGFKP